MLRLSGSVHRLASVALLTLAACGASMSARRQAPVPHAGLWTAPMRAASALVATLPSGLTLPPVSPTWRLISMIADDIDADGDLDVVANDGSLDLVVWINDGTGRLSRQDDRKALEGPQKVAGAALSERPTESRVAAQVPGSALLGASAIASLPLSEPRSRWTGSAEVLLDDLVAARSPRGPPSASLTL